MNKICITLLLAALLSACASSNSGDVYSREQTRQPMTVKTGVLESVRQVKIEGTQSPVGTIAGGAVGGIAGSTIGNGKGSAIGAVVGAVAGGLLGSAAEEKLTQKEGVELTIKLSTGNVIAVVQEATETFRVGETVRILEGGGVTRVTH